MNVQDNTAGSAAANPVMMADRGRLMASDRLPAMPVDVTARIERALTAEASRRTALAQDAPIGPRNPSASVVLPVGS
jgi:hypothetical protein